MNSPLWDNSANGTRYVFGGIDDLRLLKESGWYKELLIYNDERSRLIWQFDLKTCRWLRRKPEMHV